MSVLRELTEIASRFDSLEGNCFTYHETNIPAPELMSKQRNLSAFAKGKKHILEIGFNAGHSAALFLEANPDVRVVSVDIGYHNYTRACFLHLLERYGDRITLILEDSKNIPLLDLPSAFFDGVHVDGYHGDDYYMYDVFSVLRLMKDTAELIMDDTQDAEIARWSAFLRSSVLFSPAPGYEPTTMYMHDILTFHRPRVAVACLAIGDAYTQSVEPCLRSIQTYCKAWNIPLHLGEETLDTTRPLPWSKIKHVQSIIKTNNYDIVLWIDADVLVLNTAVSLDELLLFLPKSCSMLLGADAASTKPNTGVFAIQCTPASVQLLDDVYSQTEFIHHSWWEQAAFLHCMDTQPDFARAVRVLPSPGSRILNAFPPWFGEAQLAHHPRPDDWIVHFAGKRGDMLRYFMNLYLAPMTRKGLTHQRLSLLAGAVHTVW